MAAAADRSPFPFLGRGFLRPPSVCPSVRLRPPSGGRFARPTATCVRTLAARSKRARIFSGGLGYSEWIPMT